MFLKEKREGEPCSTIDPEKLDELRKQATKTEKLASCVVSELHSGDPEPPTLDALAEISYGARLIRKGTAKLREDC
jgi:hypothetical protein